jgi:hypothetical protein
VAQAHIFEGMEFGNIGGIALILAGLVWLAVFVPSWARRSELRALEQNAKSYARAERGQPTREDKLSKTRSIFALAALAGFVAVGLAIFAGGSAWLIPAFGVPAALATLISLAANRALNSLVAKNFEARARKREQVSRKLEQTSPASGWTPNPLPQPLNTPKRGELIAPDAEVIPISRSSSKAADPITQSLDSGEIIEILKRRRAI